MVEEALAEGAPETAGPLRALGEGDRDVMERATRAFVSYVRGYKEHQVRCAVLGGVQLAVACWSVSRRWWSPGCGLCAAWGRRCVIPSVVMLRPCAT
jgi:hypothetical protein